MSAYNKVIVMGNITRNPELRYTPSGSAVCDLSLAINESYKNKAGETVDQTCFVEIVVWGKQAENCSEYLQKGSAALVDGSLMLDTWETKEGDKRSKLRVRASSVQFIGKVEKRAQEQSSTDSDPSTGTPAESFDEGEDDLPF